MKLWGRVIDDQDQDLHRRFADDLFQRTGFDLRGRKFEPFYLADLTGASSVTMKAQQMIITSWKPGADERIRTR